MSVKRIIQESLDKNPLGVKEALEEALQDRVRAALEEKYAEMTESKHDDDDDDDDDDDEDMDESFDLSEEEFEFINSMLDEGYDLDDVIDALVEQELEEGSIKGSGTDRKAQLKKAYRAGEADTRDFNRPGGMPSRKPKRGSDSGIKKAYQGGRDSNDGGSAAKGERRSKSQDGLAGTQHGNSQPSRSIFGGTGKTHYKTQTHAAKMYSMAKTKPKLPK